MIVMFYVFTTVILIIIIIKGAHMRQDKSGKKKLTTLHRKRSNV